MDKQFELSAYGVEELNEEEIFLINGGVAVLAIVGVCVAVAGLVWAVYAHYDGQKVIATKMASSTIYGDTMLILLKKLRMGQE